MSCLIVDSIVFFLSDILLQILIRKGLGYVISLLGWAVRTPVYIFQIVLDMGAYVLKNLFALPFELTCWLVNYLVYTGLYPYVYMAYSSLGVGLAALILPELVRKYNISIGDVRRMLRFAGYAPGNGRNADDNCTNRDGVSAVLALLEDRTKLQRECVVCYEAKELVGLKPCGHNGVCMTCILQIQAINNKCPVCRRRIETVTHL